MNFGRQHANNFASLFSFKDISEKTQQHLQHVYGLVLVCSLVCALGMYTNSAIVIGGFLLTLASIALSIFFICQVANRGNSDNMRMGCLAGLAFQMGFLIGPVMHVLVAVDPKLVLQAVLYTATAFVSFSLVSLCSKRRSMLFLGGVIACLFQGMMMYQFFGWMLGYSFYNMAYLLFGLLLACLYIIYDTQMIIERAENGDKDVITHAMLLFVDLFDLFVKILQILIKLKEDGERKNKK